MVQNCAGCVHDNLFPIKLGLLAGSLASNVTDVAEIRKESSVKFCKLEYVNKKCSVAKIMPAIIVIVNMKSI